MTDTNSTFVRRPWVNFWDSIPYDSKQLDQQMKLVRNQVASMDLGLPGFNLYDSNFDRNGHPRVPKPSGRELYLEWVADWKKTYASLSECIRLTRAQRTHAGFRHAKKPSTSNHAVADNVSYESNTYRIRSTLETLRKAAQVMLNARQIGKLASAQLRVRSK